VGDAPFDTTAETSPRVLKIARQIAATVKVWMTAAIPSATGA